MVIYSEAKRVWNRDQYVVSSEYSLEIIEYMKDSDYPQGWDNKVKVYFRKKHDLHRVDGPAVVTWDLTKKGVTRMYYIQGSLLEADKVLYLLNCPLFELPLYLTIPFYCEIVRHRLSGSKVELKFNAHEHLRSKVLSKVLAPDFKLPQASPRF
jgi:hypothetical protein